MNAISTDATLSSATPTSRDYARVAEAITYIIARRAETPSLDALAGHVGLSPFHFQRVFKRWAGVSPKQFMSYITVEHAKAALERSAPVLDAAFDAGLSSGSRLHDAFVNVHAMTPGEYKTQGRDLVIHHGVHDTAFGPALILTTDRGICGMDFIASNGVDEALARAQQHWSLSRFVGDQKATGAIVAHMLDPKAPRSLLMRGTNFQIQVWSALLRVPAGAIVSYGDIAGVIGQPDATRAVGTALGANTIGYLVPCHRVLRATGLFKNYRWGAARRYAMLGWEAASQA